MSQPKNKTIQSLTANFDRTNLVRRSFGTVLGVLGVGVGVGFYRMALFGMDPFQTLMGGLDAIIPGATFGTIWLVTLCVMLIVPIIFKCSLIGPGTILNLIAVGFAIETSHSFLLETIPNHSIPLRILWLVIGVIIIALAMAFYFTANMGVSAFDAISLVLAEHFQKIPFKYWRVISDWSALIIGVILFLLAGNAPNQLGRLIGIGTIVAAFGMGPLIVFFSEKLAKPLLYPAVQPR